MSALSDYLNAHIPAGWSKSDVTRALGDYFDRTTVYRYLAGNHSRNPPEYVLDAFAKALGCSITQLREAAGAADGEGSPDPAAGGQPAHLRAAGRAGSAHPNHRSHRPGAEVSPSRARSQRPACAGDIAGSPGLHRPAESHR